MPLPSTTHNVLVAVEAGARQSAPQPDLVGDDLLASLGSGRIVDHAREQIVEAAILGMPGEHMQLSTLIACQPLLFRQGRPESAEQALQPIGRCRLTDMRRVHHAPLRVRHRWPRVSNGEITGSGRVGSSSTARRMSADRRPPGCSTRSASGILAGG